MNISYPSLPKVFWCHFFTPPLVRPFSCSLLFITTDWFAFSRILYKGNHRVYTLAFVWLLSLPIIMLRFIHVITCISGWFFFFVEWYSIAWIYHLLTNMWVVPSFLVLLINLLWLFVYNLCMKTCFYFSWGKYPWLEWWDYMVGIYLIFLGNYQTVFQLVIVSHILKSTEWEFQFLYFVTQHLILSVFLTLIHVFWYFHMVLVCNSLMNNDVEHLPVCSFATHISILVKYLFKFFAHFLFEFFSYYWGFSPKLLVLK